MNIALWILAGLLALTFVMSGIMKLSKPRADLETQMGWVADVSDAQLKAIGAIDALGGIGLVLPAAVGVAPVLVPIAATGLVLQMIGAVAVHVRRGDPPPVIAVPVVLGLLAAIVAIGRFGPAGF